MTPRNKNILLMVGFLLLLVVSYRLAIAKTFALKKEIALLNEKNVNVDALAHLSSQLSQREHFADSLLKKNNIKNTSIQNALLEFLNNASGEHDFSIETFQEPHTAILNDVKVTSYRFSLRGAYKDLQQVLYQLEQNYNFGQISHLAFERKRDYRRGRDYLECSVILESFLSE